jgi:drug/metabolite transporter (DMT)-like permease
MIDIVPSPSIGVGFALAGAFLLALQSLSVRYGTTEASSSDILLYVLVVNSVVFVPIGSLFGDSVSSLDPYTVGAFLGVSVFGLLLGRTLHFEGIRRVGASRADAIKASQPLHASLIAVLVLGEIVTAGHLFAMVAIVVGIALITMEYRDAETDGGGILDLVVPFSAAFCYGISPTFVSLGLDTGVSIWTGLAIMSVGATIPYSLVLWLTGNLPEIRKFDRRERFWFLAAGGINCFFIVCYYVALRNEPVSLVVPLFQLSPLVVITLSTLFVRNELERVTWRLASSALIVLSGAIGVTILSAG